MPYNTNNSFSSKSDPKRNVTFGTPRMITPKIAPKTTPKLGGVRKAPRYRRPDIKVRTHTRALGKVKLTVRLRIAVKCGTMTHVQAMARARAHAREQNGITIVTTYTRRSSSQKFQDDQIDRTPPGEGTDDVTGPPGSGVSM
jgi:hypothetical protein